ncbi:ribonuclease Y [Nakamurella sp. YIM 132084]|uniref:Ribonuclease Y n=2 Tax=Nakamurella leprariae TaxID=2803911 RepID=A0A939C0G5_9ACTN|nr:ribonuclease Y [Nakamurella leprariae]
MTRTATSTTVVDVSGSAPGGAPGRPSVPDPSAVPVTRPSLTAPAPAGESVALVPVGSATGAVPDPVRRAAERLRQDAEEEARQVLDAARAQVARLRAGLDEERQALRAEVEQSLAQERSALDRTQTRLRESGAALSEQQTALAAQQQALADQQRSVLAERTRITADREQMAGLRTDLERRMRDLTEENRRVQQQWDEVTARVEELDRRSEAVERELSRVSGLSTQQARTELLARQARELRRELALDARRLEQEAQATAQQRARAIVADAIQRVASDQTAQTVVTVMPLPSDDLKGRIIGREGRNIRAFETVTGVNVIIDDTPEAVLLSCFDPVRREIGRITLQLLVDDGRIHPHRIEEAYERAKDEVDVLCRRAAEDAVVDADVAPLHPELMSLIGHLKYRVSYGQNVLGHLVECAHIARAMALELGIDPEIAARGAFLHDIGKALTHEAQGSHAIVGAELARRYGESEAVAHCIEAHHDEVQPSTVEAVLTQAADACSGGRPGARRESLESYVQRLERIEAIAAAKKGVEKVFAMQAGREVRVMVKPEVVDDLETHVLAREVAKQIEEELTYPGQVRVTVIRESRATEIAR